MSAESQDRKVYMLYDIRESLALAIGTNADTTSAVRSSASTKTASNEWRTTGRLSLPHGESAAQLWVRW